MQPPRSARAATARRQPKKTPVAFTSRVRRQAASSVSAMEPAVLTPALLTRQVGRPNAASAPSNACAHWPSSATSSGVKRAAAPIASAAARPAPASTSATTTHAPSAAKRSAMARPMP